MENGDESGKVQIPAEYMTMHSIFPRLTFGELNRRRQHSTLTGGFRKVVGRETGTRSRCAKVQGPYTDCGSNQMHLTYGRGLNAINQPIVCPSGSCSKNPNHFTKRS